MIREVVVFLLHVALFLILASFLIGIVGFGIHEELEFVLMDLLSGRVSLTGLESSWKVFAGFLIIFYVPVAGLSFVSYIWHSGNPVKRASLFEGLRRSGVSLVLISISFFLYGLVLAFVQGFTDLALVLVSSGSGFRESVFFTGFLSSDVDFWSFFEGDVASQVLFDVYKSGVYTLSMFLLIGTLGVQRVLMRFGVLFFPLSVFLYNLPSGFLNDYGLKLAKGLGLILFLPVLDVLFLSIVGLLPRGTLTEQIVYILGFLVVGLFNWSVIKKVVLNPFNQVRPNVSRVDLSLPRGVVRNDSSDLERRNGFYKVKNGDVTRLKDLNRD
jgi:hypothetical protein